MRSATMAVCAATLFAQACAAREIPWSIANPQERPGTRYRIELRETCGGPTLERAVVARGTSAPRWSLPSGRALAVVAIDGDCRVYAAGCRPIAREEQAVEVVLEPVRPEYAECPVASCKEGECSDVDAGIRPFDGAVDCAGAVDGSPCGPSECGEFSGCTFADDCTNEGRRVRVCTEHVCDGGECVRREREDRAICPRDTEGFPCANGSFCDEWSGCIGETLCARAGTRTRECSDARCVGGQCQETRTEQEERCTRDTEGSTCSLPRCGEWGACQARSACEPFGVQTRTCEAMQCRDERCVTPAMYEETTTCPRVGEMRCDDGNRCTTNDRCGIGTCQGTCPVSGGTVCNCSAAQCFEAGGPICPT